MFRIAYFRSWLWAVALIAVVTVGCQTDIRHGLEETQANELVTMLGAHNIAAQTSRDGRQGWLVSVPRGDAGTALVLMQATGIPRRQTDGFERAFGEGGLIPTPIEENVRLMTATAGELEAALMAIDGVLDARVNLVVQPDTRLPNQTASPPRASVLLVFVPNETADADDVTAPISNGDVRRLVSGAVADLDPQSVEIISTTRRGSGVTGTALVSVGPMSVSASSATTLRMLFGVLVVLVLALSTAVVVLLGRRRRLEPVEQSSREAVANKAP